MKKTITILPTERSQGTRQINQSNSLIYSFSNLLGEKVAVMSRNVSCDLRNAQQWVYQIFYKVG